MIILILSCYFYQVASIECSSLQSQEVTIDIYSDIDDWVVGNLYPNGAFGVPMLNEYKRSTFPFGLKIWESTYPYLPTIATTCYIGKEFIIPGTPISASLIVLGDDKVTSSKINDQDIGCSTTYYTQVKTCDAYQYINSGSNVINFTVVNNAGSTRNNIAGIIYKLSVKTLVKGIDLIKN